MISAVAALSVGLEALPLPSFGKFEQCFFSLKAFFVGSHFGIYDFSAIGTGLMQKDVGVQDVTIEIGVSSYVVFGGFAEFGFNFSKFFRLMGW